MSNHDSMLRRWRQRISVRGSTRCALVNGFALVVAISQALQAQQSAPTGRVASRPLTAAADAAFAAGDRAAAEREYAAVLQSSPDDSRALYMLAQLRRDRVHEAVALLHRYVRL